MNTDKTTDARARALRYWTMAGLGVTFVVVGMGAESSGCCCLSEAQCPKPVELDGGAGLVAEAGVAEAGVAEAGTCTCNPSSDAVHPEWGEQGVHLQGIGINECAASGSARAIAREFSLAGMTKGGQPVTNVTVQQGKLVGQLSGSDLAPTAWVNVELKGKLSCVNDEGQKDIEAKIVAVQQDTTAKLVAQGVSNAYVYKVELKSPVTGSRVAACNGDWAVPFADYWFSNGLPSTTAPVDRFTFACVNAAIGKCYHWGYVPWKNANTRALHTACTRMARADYCGTTKSHTTDGTWVNVWDTDNINQQDAGLPPVAAGTVPPSFEAAWQATGAVCINHLRHTSLTPTCFGGSTSDPSTRPSCASADAVPDAGLPLLYNESVVQP